MQGICIDAGTSAVLEQGKTYFLFNHGKNNVYVGNFENVRSQFGSFQRKQFEIVKEEKAAVKPVEKLVDNPVVKNFTPVRHVAIAKRNQAGIRKGAKYIIGPSEHAPYYNVYLLDRPNVPIASYITLFFEIIALYEEIETPQHVRQPETPQIEPIEETNVNTLPIEVKV